MLDHTQDISEIKRLSGLSIDNLLKELTTSLDGLQEKGAKKKLALFGANSFEVTKKTHILYYSTSKHFYRRCRLC